MLLDDASKAYGGKNTDGFREFISNKNKDEFSSLNTASKEGHAEIVQMLLDDASKAYGGKNTDGFREFISSQNKDGFSPLNTASKEGHAGIVEVLLDDASKAYGGKEQNDFVLLYINCKNSYGFTPLRCCL